MNMLKLVALCVTVLLIDSCHGEDLDKKLNENKDKLMNAVAEKCKTKAISSESLLKILNECIEPIVRDSKLFPAKVYPKKFEEIKTQCIMNAPAPNVCEPEAINKFKSCSMVKAMPMVAEMKKLYKDKKPQLAALFDKLAKTCLPKYQAL